MSLRQVPEVLILVVMEYTQWAFSQAKDWSKWSLNPCCNGIYSMRCVIAFSLALLSICLNPCCNGIYSMRVFSFHQKQNLFCLNPCCNGIYSMRHRDCNSKLYAVLILVVMEYTQWEQRLTYPLYKAFWFIISMTAIVI